MLRCSNRFQVITGAGWVHDKTFNPSHFKEFTMYNFSEQIAAVSKSNVETFLKVANTTFASTERFAALNLSAARSALEDGAASVSTLMAIKDVESFAKIQSKMALPGMEKAIAYSRSAYDIATQTGEALKQVVESQFAQISKTVNVAFDEVLKSAPAGSDVAVNAVKSAISAANSAYDNMNKAAKQVSEITEANINSATSAAISLVKKAA
jgi:phasin family protein